MGLNIGGNIKSIYFGGNVKEIWIGSNKIFGGGGGSVDPSIVMCYYGNGLQNIGLSPSSGSQVASYDSASPLDLEGTGWSGFPYLSNSGAEIKFIQDEILALENEDLTIDFWWYEKKSGYQNQFIAGYKKNSGTRTWDLAVSMGVAYGNYNTSVFSNSDFGQDLIDSEVYGKWNHFALTSEIVNDKRQIKMYSKGILRGNVLTKDKYICQSFSIGGAGEFRCIVGQVCVRRGIKWRGNFTPPTKPYFLGE